jgi:two-component system OmpR family response regulator
MKNSDNTLSLFLVDDDVMFLSALRHKIHEKFKSTLHISTFSDGEECLRHMDDKPDIVVLDYYLNHDFRHAMNGLEVLEKIKTVSEETQVLMLSSEEKQEVQDKSIRLGAYKYLSKNQLSSQNLQNAIKDVIHEIIIDRNAKENRQLNFIMGAVALAVVGLIIYLYYRYF